MIALLTADSVALKLLCACHQSGLLLAVSLPPEPPRPSIFKAATEMELRHSGGSELEQGCRGEGEYMGCLNLSDSMAEKLVAEAEQMPASEIQQMKTYYPLPEEASKERARATQTVNQALRASKA